MRERERERERVRERKRELQTMVGRVREKDTKMLHCLFCYHSLFSIRAVK